MQTAFGDGWFLESPQESADDVRDVRRLRIQVIYIYIYIIYISVTIGVHRESMVTWDGLTFSPPPVILTALPFRLLANN